MQVRNGWRLHRRHFNQPASLSKDARFFVQTMGSTSGQLRGRKVGRKWITTRNAVMRWLEQLPKSRRAMEAEDNDAIIKALQSGSVRVRAA
jgi:hypothetical protein